jgi:hypothetical protein
MAINITLVRPTTPTDVSNNTEIVVSIIEDTAAAIDLNSIIATVNDGSGQIVVYQSQTFQNNWSGELINNNPGTEDDLDLVLIRPLSSPLYPFDSLVSVVVQATV